MVDKWKLKFNFFNLRFKRKIWCQKEIKNCFCREGLLDTQDYPVFLTLTKSEYSHAS